MKTKDGVQQQVGQEGRGSMTHTRKQDGLKRIKDGPKAFNELNNNLPKDLKLPISSEYK